MIVMHKSSRRGYSSSDSINYTSRSFNNHNWATDSVGKKNKKFSVDLNSAKKLQKKISKLRPIKIKIEQQLKGVFGYSGLAISGEKINIFTYTEKTKKSIIDIIGESELVEFIFTSRKKNPWKSKKPEVIKKPGLSIAGRYA